MFTTCIHVVQHHPHQTCLHADSCNQENNFYGTSNDFLILTIFAFIFDWTGEKKKQNANYLNKSTEKHITINAGLFHTSVWGNAKRGHAKLLIKFQGTSFIFFNYNVFRNLLRFHLKRGKVNQYLFPKRRYCRWNLPSQPRHCWRNRNK